jgi:hypothetical protein
MNKKTCKQGSFIYSYALGPHNWVIRTYILLLHLLYMSILKLLLLLLIVIHLKLLLLLLVHWHLIGVELRVHLGCSGGEGVGVHDHLRHLGNEDLLLSLNVDIYIVRDGGVIVHCLGVSFHDFIEHFSTMLGF